MGIIDNISQSIQRRASRFRSAGKPLALLQAGLFVLLYAVLANIPMWLASKWLAILCNDRFNLDYIVVGLLALLLPRAISAVLMLLAISIDLVQGVCGTYFFNVSQCFSNLNGIRQFSFSRHLAMAAVLLLALTASILPPYLLLPARKKYRAWGAASLVFFALVCFSIDGVQTFRRTGRLPGLVHMDRYSPPQNEDETKPVARLSRIPTVRLVREEMFPAPAGFPMQNATAIGLSYLAQAQHGPENGQERPNFVLVLVESWGKDADPAIAEALVQPYAQPALTARYRVLEGMVPFHGPTAAGEARELCGSTMSYHIIQASAQEFKDCIPSRLASLGYRTVALHGMEGDFYSRSNWYKTAGFEDIWFEDRFHLQGLPICRGSFMGICDSAIAEWMGHRLQSDKAQPDFLYWVTLNSHLPVLVPSPLKDGASCAFTPALSEEPTLCSWYQLEAEVHRSVAALALANLGRPTIFVIVGDHAPPFSDPKLRGRFASDLVPYVLLVPRAAGAMSNAPTAAKTGK